MIVLEGTDLVGKSTLARKLIRECDEYIGVLGLSRITVDEWIWWDYMKLTNPKIIADRWIYSGMAYDQVLRADQPDIEENELRMAHHALESRTFRVVVTAEPDIIVKRFETRGDDMFNLDSILKVNGWFIKNTELFDLAIHCTPDEPFASNYWSRIRTLAHKKLS